MTTQIINEFGCIMPEWLFPFKRKYSSILKTIEVAPECICGKATREVGDLHLTFSGISGEELQKILGGKGTFFFSKNKNEILVCGYSE